MSRKLIIFALAASLFGAGCVDISVRPNERPKAEVRENDDFRISEADVLGHRYTVFTPRALAVRFSVTRPAEDDGKIVLVVPGTYTSPSAAPEGFIVVDGKIIQRRERQAWNGAALVHKDGTVTIVETNNGKMLSGTFLDDAVRNGNSLFQAHLLVHAGKAELLKPQVAYQRRALAVMPDGSARIIESQDMLDLQVFAAALVEFGVQDAVNLDMGSYSEGWYRDPENGEVRGIGYLTADTALQSNWLVFSK